MGIACSGGFAALGEGGTRWRLGAVAMIGSCRIVVMTDSINVDMHDIAICVGWYRCRLISRSPCGCSAGITGKHCKVVVIREHVGKVYVAWS